MASASVICRIKNAALSSFRDLTKLLNLEVSNGTSDTGPTPMTEECILNITLVTNPEGWTITANDQLVTELAKNPRVKVYGLVPSSTQEQRDQAKRSNIELVNAKKLIGYSEKDCLAFPPDGLAVDVLIIHSYGYDLGRQAQIIKETKKCKWVHIVHTISEEIEKYNLHKGDPKWLNEHKVQLDLCQEADIIIAIGPKVADAYRSAMYFCGKDKDVINLTPEIVHDLLNVRPMRDDGEIFRVMISATYPAKYFKVKGCDVAAKAITLLQDPSYHLIFVVLPDDNAEDLKTKLDGDISLSQYAVTHVSRSTEDWKKLLCYVDLAIMPSAEGFGTSCLRAISANLPILSSGNSGFGMALKKLPSGEKHVLNSEKPQVWADKIKEIRQKGPEKRDLEARQLQKEYMEKYSWKDQCDRLVNKMIKMLPSKQGGNKISVEHTEEIVHVQSAYSESRMQQGKIENTWEQENENDIIKKGAQEMRLTDTNRNSLGWEATSSNKEFQKTVEQEEDTAIVKKGVQKMSLTDKLTKCMPEQEEDIGITKTSVEETGLTDKSPGGLDQKNIGHDLVDSPVVQPTSSRLSTNVSDIPLRIHRKVCMKLNIKDDLYYSDFRMLGEVMGYDRDVTRNLEQEKNPTNELLKMWCSSNRQATVGRLIELLKHDDLERMDVVEILEKWVEETPSK